MAKKEKPVSNGPIKKATKRDTITIRLEEDWDRYIEETALALSKKMEIEVTKTWIVTQLMKLGLPIFEKKYNVRRKDAKKASDSDVRQTA